ncbi:glycoside hydrolase family 25 protein [Leucogyrophana mollusca]|uniref:Glycoside hydrolase family 25 protein n=1 Tax=Leucogyrophana mollusca TaxID=85980 RepID=A0ACB8BGL5_9AGAM|nr:glycoside hydrolase family 25 protein [Leucogyrophana mollusca]
MKSFSALTFIAVAATLAGANPVEKRYSPSGIDVSAYQGNVNWGAAKNNGVTFAYIKATEGVSYTNPSFSSQYQGATNAGLIRGAYHFGHPNSGPGDAQARYFVSHGGGWSNDGITLPGALDIEYNPAKGGNACYGLGASSMVQWIQAFSNQYNSLTGRYPVLYTTTDWWKTCTGNNGGFGNNNPLWLAHHSSNLGPLPAGWEDVVIWQYAEKGSNPGDQNYFNGSDDDLQQFAASG